MDKDSADISTEAPPASMHRPRLRLRRAVDIESRQIVDFGENSVSQIPTDDLLKDGGKTQEFCSEGIKDSNLLLPGVWR
ncbi:MAG: hypothetical protein L6R41_006661 [Letrouitia leprolyta]|nr:MAG: hypothetical protein L6R41_006661 [Letrouitia leprolyta]